MAEQANTLETQMRELSRDITIHTAQFVDVVGKYDHSRGWAPRRMRSCADWLVKECQFAPSTARERVRVARALEQLPRLRAAFAAGEISFSKIRIVTRTATPENEVQLLALALSMTAAELERRLALRRRPGKGGLDDCPDGTISWRIRRDGKVKLEAVLTQDQFEALMAGMNSAHEELMTSGTGGTVSDSAVPSEGVDAGANPSETLQAESQQEEVRAVDRPAHETVTGTSDTGIVEDSADPAGAPRAAVGPGAWFAGQRSGTVGIEVLVAMARSQVRARTGNRDGAPHDGRPEATSAGPPADVAA